jgi:hypothetical protein
MPAPEMRIHMIPNPFVLGRNFAQALGFISTLAVHRNTLILWTFRLKDNSLLQDFPPPPIGVN